MARHVVAAFPNNDITEGCCGMFDLREMAQSKVLVAAHRGTWMGNIPCNTSMAFNFALAQGVDIIELDITRSADGTLYVFHPGTEPHFLHSE